MGSFRIITVVAGTIIWYLCSGESLSQRFGCWWGGGFRNIYATYAWSLWKDGCPGPDNDGFSFQLSVISAETLSIRNNNKNTIVPNTTFPARRQRLVHPEDSQTEPVSAVKDAQIWAGLLIYTPRSKVTLTISLFIFFLQPRGSKLW